MSKTAFVIIDVQVAMFSYVGTYPYHGDQVLQNIKLLLEKARATGTPVIYIQHNSDDEFKKGTPTWNICPEIQPIQGEFIVEKTKCDAFYKTKFQEVLQQLSITNLIIAGMQTEFCLDTTCRRAFSMGYESILVQDAHTTFDSEVLSAEQIVQHHNNVLGNSFVQLKTTEEMLKSDFKI